jgi:hypothetical protein
VHDRSTTHGTDFDAPYFHVGLVVEDLDAAMKELSAATGLQWAKVVTREIGDWTYRLVYSRTGPPYVELVEGGEGTPWDVSNGPRLDHLGWWIGDVDAELERLAAVGVPVERDLRQLGSAAFVKAPASGLKIELIGRDRRSRFEQMFSGQ